MLIAVFKNKFIVSFITISGTISTKKLRAWLLFHYRLSTNIPTISIMSPIHAASEAMIASAVAETREKQQSRLFRTLERKFVKRFSRKTWCFQLAKQLWRKQLKTEHKTQSTTTTDKTIGGVHPLSATTRPFPLSSPLLHLTGFRGYNPRENFGIKGACR